MYSPRAAGRTLVTESTNAAAMKQELDFYRGGCIQEEKENGKLGCDRRGSDYGAHLPSSEKEATNF